MAQAQLNCSKDMLSLLRGYGLKHLSWSPVHQTITCQLDDMFSIVIRKTGKCMNITLKKGTQTMSLSSDMFEKCCDLKESIQLLASFLEG